MRTKGTITPIEVILAKDITPLARLVLSFFINTESNYPELMDPTQAELANIFGVTTVCMNNTLTSLVEKGYLESVRLKGLNGKFRNFYHVMWDRIKENNNIINYTER